jgi:hypothetical protein
MDRLFAGPTANEHASGLRLLQSKATGFAGPSIAAGVARVRLTGGCSSGGSTVSIAQQILPTLKQLPNVRFVKGRARAQFRTEHVHADFSLLSRRDPRFALVDGTATPRHRLWAAWLHHNRLTDG